MNITGVGQTQINLDGSIFACDHSVELPLYAPVLIVVRKEIVEIFIPVGTAQAAIEVHFNKSGGLLHFGEHFEFAEGELLTFGGAGAHLNGIEVAVGDVERHHIGGVGRGRGNLSQRCTPATAIVADIEIDAGGQVVGVGVEFDNYLATQGPAEIYVHITVITVVAGG